MIIPPVDIDRRVLSFVGQHEHVPQGEVVRSIAATDPLHPDPAEVADSVRRLQEANALQRDERCLLVQNPWYSSDN